MQGSSAWAKSVDFYLEIRHVCLVLFIPLFVVSKYCAKCVCSKELELFCSVSLKDT